MEQVKQEVSPYSFQYPGQPLSLRVGPADRWSHPHVEGVTCVRSSDMRKNFSPEILSADSISRHVVFLQP